MLTVAAGILIVVAGLAFALRHYPAGTSFTLGLVAATPYIMLAAPVAAALAGSARQWIVMALALLVVVLCASSQVGLYTSTDPPRAAQTLTVLTTNLRLGEGKAADVVTAVRRHHVDLLMVEELTDSARTALHAAGLDELLPHVEADPRVAAEGTGLWSRFPLSNVRRPSGFTFATIMADVAVPDLPRPLTAVAVHLAGPVPDATNWRGDIARLPDVLKELVPTGPVIVGGDFNATPDTTQFRSVLRAGFADAADQAGAGMTRTYPADSWLPPLIAIDHVLTKGGAVATGARTISIAGSDHRALLVTVAVPR